jgi:rSAM/selenodomain-associated transferase 1
MTMTSTVPGRSALYIAAKAPRPGFAKTRLARGVGQRAALGLYRAFLRDLGARFVALPADYALGWYITPPDAWPDLAPLVTSPGARTSMCILAQGDGDWATRQDSLFAGAAARGEERTILIASDSPHLTVEVVVAAFHQLDRHDLVLGPVADGGYYLIGMKGWCDILHGVPMSTGSVLRDLIARARAQGHSVGLVAPTFDIDEASDLDRLRRLAATRADLAATYAALREYGLLGDPYPVPTPAFAEATPAD